MDGPYTHNSKIPTYLAEPNTDCALRKNYEEHSVAVRRDVNQVTVPVDHLQQLRPPHCEVHVLVLALQNSNALVKKYIHEYLKNK